MDRAIGDSDIGGRVVEGTVDPPATRSGRRRAVAHCLGAEAKIAGVLGDVSGEPEIDYVVGTAIIVNNRLVHGLSSHRARSHGPAPIIVTSHGVMIV